MRIRELFKKLGLRPLELEPQESSEDAHAEGGGDHHAGERLLRLSSARLRVRRIPMAEAHERALQALSRRGRCGRYRREQGLDFSSNDYLGLGNSPEVEAGRGGKSVSARRRAWVRAARGFCAGMIPSMRHWKTKPLASLAPRTALYSRRRFPRPIPRSFRPCRNAAILSSMTSSSTPACMTGDAQGGRQRSRRGITMPQSFDGQIATWRSRGRDRSALDRGREPFTAWMAIVRRWSISWRWPNATTACWSSTKPTRRAFWGDKGRGLGCAFRGTRRTLFRCTPAARPWGSWAGSFWRRGSSVISSSTARGHSSMRLLPRR